MNEISSKALFEKVKNFLELAQPLSVHYGYTRGVKSEQSFVTYRATGTTFQSGIGGDLLSERRNFIVTVQTKTMEQNMLYRDLIVYATQGTNFALMSEDLRKDTTVDSGWINTLIITIYNGLEKEQAIFTRDEVKIILQEIADRYILITNVYREGSDLIYRFVIPDLEDKNYTRAEMLALKQTLLDKLLLTTTEY